MLGARGPREAARPLAPTCSAGLALEGLPAGTLGAQWALAIGTVARRTGTLPAQLSLLTPVNVGVTTARGFLWFSRI